MAKKKTKAKEKVTEVDTQTTETVDKTKVEPVKKPEVKKTEVKGKTKVTTKKKSRIKKIIGPGGTHYSSEDFINF